MAKIALITDTHWGIRNDNQTLQNYLKKSSEFFFKYIDAHEIKHCIHLGDLFDRRKYVNFITAKYCKESFLEQIDSRGIDTHIIAGNHDVYHKNTNEVNALDEVVSNKYKSIHTYISPHELEVDGFKMLLLPWICDANLDESMKAINTTSAQVCMGHLELNGFEMFRGSISDHGMDHKIFQRFDIVCSGHYHHKSDTGNIHYLGAFAEYTWSDYDDPRGFHIFDTDTRELTFIQNPYKLFYKYYYDDLNKSMNDVVDIDLSSYENCYVKIIVKNKDNPYWFDLVLDKFEKSGASNTQIVEDTLSLGFTDDDVVDEAEDTLQTLKKYSAQFDHKHLEKFITDLYNESLAVE